MKPLFSIEEKRALCGFWRQSLYQFPNKLKIFAMIAGSIFALCVIIEILNHFHLTSSGLQAGFLSLGVMIGGPVLWISALFEGERRNLNSMLVFPLNRKIFLIGGFMAMLRDTASILAGVSIFAALEILTAQIIKFFRPELVLNNLVNLTNYWDGLWISFSIFALVYAICYCLGVYLTRAKMKTTAALGILVVLFTNRYINFSIDTVFLKTVHGLIMAESLPIFHLKTWSFVGLVYLLAYLPLRRLEA
jgi:hypothetical protein